MYEGDCNGCGRCCTTWYGGVHYRCANLLLADEVGKPAATFCAVYHTRRIGMPVVMLGEEGSVLASTCLPIYPRAHDAIPSECSYKFVPDELIQIQPKWRFTYAPKL